MSKPELLEQLRFVERQIKFILETTKEISTYHDFLISMDRMVLMNSTCMCLQSIGEAIKKVDNMTKGKLFGKYPETPWKQIIRMRDIISHDYLSIDVEIVFSITKEELQPLLSSVRRVISDLEREPPVD